MIDFYTGPTPNGWRVAIALEEMELLYAPHVLNLSERMHSGHCGPRCGRSDDI
jgi:glutathione S-transferase